MKPWVNDERWFRRYATSVAAIKRPTATSQEVQELEDIISDAFTRVYRAVAFDIDGTLTISQTNSIDQGTATLVGRLLQRGVPVILITGRGRASTRSAAEQIRQISGLSDWYMRRLQCVTSNGVILLTTSTDRPFLFLGEEAELINPSVDIGVLLKEVRKVARRYADGVHISEEPCSIRLEFESEGVRDKLAEEINRLIEAQQFSKLFVTQGEYGPLKCLDISSSNKDVALREVARRLGVDSEHILRIGDQGQDHGNDYHLLASKVGFSVDRLSSDMTHCHPVLDEDLLTQLKGAAATEALLNRVLLFAPLSVTPAGGDDAFYRSLRRFERIALRRSQKERETVTQRVRVRLRYLVGDDPQVVDIHSLELSEIFDDLSGGIRFRDWELDELPLDHPGRDLFHIPIAKMNRDCELKAKWCMYTDTGILMRGPNYYFGQTRSADEATVTSFIDQSTAFIDGARQAVAYAARSEPNFVLFKLVLAVQDNIRNMLLQLLSAAFGSEGLGEVPEWSLTQRIFDELVVPHSEQHYQFLLNPDAEWMSALAHYSDLLSILLEQINGMRLDLSSRCEAVKDPRSIFKWRECDNFLQNVAAIQLALHELRQRPEVREAKNLLVMGLAFGGIELPGIARTIAKSRGFSVSCGLVKVSIYGDREMGKRIQAGERDYVLALLKEARPNSLCLLDANTTLDETPIIMVDDNCTTCVTLQLARDLLVLWGADVLGAAVVRFPGANRHAHMALAGHGFPDPQVLFSFIRGLVAPSPYSRLVFPNLGENQYLDSTQVFDKAKVRMSRHLEKNGTPFVEKLVASAGADDER